MATKPTTQKGSTPASRAATPARRTTAAVATRELTPVEFVESAQLMAPEFDVDLSKDGYTEGPSSLTPTANWTTPGEYVEGEYLGVQEGVGPNESRLYNFKMEDGTIVSVWGGTVLDNRMDMMRPPVGSIVKIVYVGDGTKKPGQNPPRIFKMGHKAK
jgi:hypothetical protein